MLTQRSEGLRRLLLICQIWITAGLFWLGVWVMVKFYSPSGELTWRRYSIYCVLLVLGLTLEYLGRDSSRDYPLQTDLLREHRVSLQQAIVSIGTLVIYLIATKDGFISRGFLFNVVPCFYLALLFSHHYLQPKFEIGLQTAGFIWQSTAEQASDLPILGQPEDFDRIVRDCGATQAILLEFPRTESDRAIIDACDELGVRLIILSDLEETLRHPVVHFEDGGFRFMALREEPLENPLNRFVKRAIDIVVSAFVLIVVFPVVSIIIWITQRLQSPGPLFHKQVRAGIQNRRFTIYKFRMMRPGDEQIAHQARGRDDRIYPLRRFFRKFSIDEIPQFWNVLRGEMSIVGPRPHLLEHNAEFAKLMAGYHVRAFVKPGITGLAQVRGFRGEARDNSDIQNRVACDLEYLENWNLSLEIGIILRTVAQLFLPPQTAY